MHRQLLRQEPEIIAAFAKDEVTFNRWQKEHDFYDTPNIKWKYIRGRYSVMGINFTMVFLIRDWYKAKDTGELVELVHRQLDRQSISRLRTFSTQEAWKGKYKYRLPPVAV